MKRSLLLTVFVAFSATLMAQSIVLSEAKNNIWIHRPNVFGTFADQDADNAYFILHSRAHNGFASKTWTDHIYTIDKKSMKMTGDVAITVSNKHALREALVSDKNVIVLYSNLNKKGDQITFTTAIIDKNEKSVTLSDANSVTTEANSQFWPDYKSAKSPNGKMMAAMAVVTGKNSQLENLFAVVVDDQGEFVWSGHVDPQFGGKTFSLGNLIVDNDGNIYIPAHTCQMNGNKISNVNFMMIRTNGNGTKSFTESVNFGTPQNFMAKVLKDGNIAVGGYYTDSKTNTVTQASGYFFYKFNNNSESFSDMKAFKFSDNYVERAVWARFSNELGNQQYSISADNIHELENGSLVLCGEHRFIKKIFNQQMNSTTYHILTKNILVSTLLPDGDSKFTMIEKQQLASLLTYPPEDWKPASISYSSFVRGNDMYFLFNDDPRNIPYPGASVVCCPTGITFRKKWESVLMHLTPDQKITQRVLPDPNQLLRGVEFTDGEHFYATGIGQKQFFITKYNIND